MGVGGRVLNIGCRMSVVECWVPGAATVTRADRALDPGSPATNDRTDFARRKQWK